MISPELYAKISECCRDLLKNSSPKVIKGDELGEELIGIDAYESAEFDHPTRGKTQINATREAARPPFEWLYEITLHNDPYMHFLIRENNDLVETYGKKVIPVDNTGAQKLLGWLEEL